MSKKIPVILAFILFALLVSSQVFAQGTGAATAGLSEKSIKFIAYFFALGLAVYGGTQAQSKAAADKIQTPMILALALMESLVIFALISTFLL